MRLIDKDELARRLNTGMNIIEVIQTIVDMPTIEERKTGRWIHKSEISAPLNTLWRYECSVCGHHAFNGMLTDYCPKCGAKMEVEHDNA